MNNIIKAKEQMFWNVIQNLIDFKSLHNSFNMNEFKLLRCCRSDLFFLSKILNFFAKNGGIIRNTRFPLASMIDLISGKPSSAKTTSPSSNESTKFDSIINWESPFLPPATFDLKQINPGGVIPISTFAVKPFL